MENEQAAETIADLEIRNEQLRKHNLKLHGELADAKTQLREVKEDIVEARSRVMELESDLDAMINMNEPYRHLKTRKVE